MASLSDSLSNAYTIGAGESASEEEKKRLENAPAPLDNTISIGSGRNTGDDGLNAVVAEDFRRGLAKHGESNAALAYGARGLVRGLLGDEKGALEDVQTANEGFERAQRIGPEIHDLSQIKDFGTFQQYVYGGAGTVLPSILEAGISAGLGGQIVKQGVKHGVKKYVKGKTKGYIAQGVEQGAQRGISPAVQQRYLQANLPKPYTYGQVGGAFSYTAPLETGGAFAEFVNEHQKNGSDYSIQQLAVAAVLSGSPAAALDAFVPLRSLRKIAPPGGSKAIVDSIRKNVVARYGKEALVTGGGEGLTEALQSAIVDAAASYMFENRELFTEENFRGWMNDFALGFIGGVGVGVPSQAAGEFIHTRLRKSVQEGIERPPVLDNSVPGDPNNYSPEFDAKFAPETQASIGALLKDIAQVDPALAEVYRRELGAIGKKEKSKKSYTALGAALVKAGVRTGSFEETASSELDPDQVNEVRSEEFIDRGLNTVKIVPMDRPETSRTDKVDVKTKELRKSGVEADAVTFRQFVEHIFNTPLQARTDQQSAVIGDATTIAEANANAIEYLKSVPGTSVTKAGEPVTVKGLDTRAWKNLNNESLTNEQKLDAFWMHKKRNLDALPAERTITPAQIAQARRDAIGREGGEAEGLRVQLGIQEKQTRGKFDGPVPQPGKRVVKEETFSLQTLVKTRLGDRLSTDKKEAVRQIGRALSEAVSDLVSTKIPQSEQANTLLDVVGISDIRDDQVVFTTQNEEVYTFGEVKAYFDYGREKATQRKIVKKREGRHDVKETSKLHPDTKLDKPISWAGRDFNTMREAYNGLKDIIPDSKMRFEVIISALYYKNTAFREALNKTGKLPIALHGKEDPGFLKHYTGVMHAVRARIGLQQAEKITKGRAVWPEYDEKGRIKYYYFVNNGEKVKLSDVLGEAYFDSYIGEMTAALREGYDFIAPQVRTLSIDPTAETTITLKGGRVITVTQTVARAIKTMNKHAKKHFGMAKRYRALLPADFNENTYARLARENYEAMRGPMFDPKKLVTKNLPREALLALKYIHAKDQGTYFNKKAVGLLKIHDKAYYDNLSRVTRVFGLGQLKAIDERIKEIKTKKNLTKEDRQKLADLNAQRESINYQIEHEQFKLDPEAEAALSGAFEDPAAKQDRKNKAKLTKVEEKLSESRTEEFTTAVLASMPDQTISDMTSYANLWAGEAGLGRPGGFEKAEKHRVSIKDGKKVYADRTVDPSNDDIRYSIMTDSQIRQEIRKIFSEMREKENNKFSFALTKEQKKRLTILIRKLQQVEHGMYIEGVEVVQPSDLGRAQRADIREEEVNHAKEQGVDTSAWHNIMSTITNMTDDVKRGVVMELSRKKQAGTSTAIEDQVRDMLISQLTASRETMSDLNAETFGGQPAPSTQNVVGVFHQIVEFLTDASFLTKEQISIELFMKERGRTRIKGDDALTVLGVLINPNILLNSNAAMSTAQHELIHVALRTLMGPKMQKLLFDYVNKPHVINQMREAFDKLHQHPNYAGADPSAGPKFFKEKLDPKTSTDPRHQEERIAYLYQLYQLGLIKITPLPVETFMQKIQQFFRDLFGILDRSGAVRDVFNALNNGVLKDYKAQNMEYPVQLINRNAPLVGVAENAQNAMAATRNVIDKYWFAADSALARMNIAAVDEIRSRIKSNPYWRKDNREGFIDAHMRNFRVFTVRWTKLSESVPNSVKQEALTEIYKETDPASIQQDDVREFVVEFRKLMDDFYKYAKKVYGKDLGFVENFFPRVFDGIRMAQDNAGFVALLMKTHPQEVTAEAARLGITEAAYADSVWEGLQKNTINRSDTVSEPHASQSSFDKTRKYPWLDTKKLIPYLERDIDAMMHRYIASITKEVEFRRVFPPNLLKRLLQNASMAATPQQMALIEQYIAVARGEANYAVPSGWLKVISWLTVYQNVRVLGLSPLISLGDPVGTLTRSEDMNATWQGFKAAAWMSVNHLLDYKERDRIKKRMNELNAKPVLTQAERQEFQQLRKDRNRILNELRQLYEDFGAMDGDLVSTTLAQLHGFELYDTKAKKINDKFFRMIGMVQLNNFNRMWASRTFQIVVPKYIAKAARGDQHAIKWLKELGIDSERIHVDPAGGAVMMTEEAIINLLVSQGDTRAAAEVKAESSIEHVSKALNRFTNESILRPDASQRPVGFNNPWISPIWHLKQFAWTMQQTIINRVYKQSKEGNYFPLVYATSWIPVIGAVEVLRHTIQYWWDDPKWDDDWTFADYLYEISLRAGLAGQNEFVLKLGEEFRKGGSGRRTIGGPFVSQSFDAIGGLVGVENGRSELVSAAPLNNVWRHFPIWPSNAELSSHNETARISDY